MQETNKPAAAQARRRTMNRGKSISHLLLGAAHEDVADLDVGGRLKDG